MRTRIIEGFKDEKTPDLKYYAFDWDDNIVHMPTKIIVKDEDGDEVGMSTEDFATYREEIGKEPFEFVVFPDINVIFSLGRILFTLDYRNEKICHVWEYSSELLSD